MTDRLLQRLGEIFAEGFDVGIEPGSFTCVEADTIAELLTLTHGPGAGREWLARHGLSDGGGDDQSHVVLARD